MSREHYPSDYAPMTNVDPNNIHDIDLFGDSPDSESFWQHHGHSKTDYYDMASHIPEVRERLRNGETLESLKSDPVVGNCASQYFDPDNMVRLGSYRDTYLCEGDGRHRILAARDLGHNIPARIDNRYSDTVEEKKENSPTDTPKVTYEDWNEDHDLLAANDAYLSGGSSGVTGSNQDVHSAEDWQLWENDPGYVNDKVLKYSDSGYQQNGTHQTDYRKASVGEPDKTVLPEGTNVVEISKSLFRTKIEKTTQPFFPNAAKDIFSAVLTHLVRNPSLNPDNHNLREFLDSCTAKDLRTMLEGYPEFRSMTSYIADDRSPQTQGVLSELQQLVREIFIGNFKKPGNLSMRSLVREKAGRKVFIEYDLGIGNMLSPIYSLMIDLAIKEALSRKKSDGSVYIIADEFRLIPNLYHIDDAVNFGRSLGAKLMIGVQNVDQIFDAYGEYRARSIMSGFQTTVSFKVGDYHSRQYITELHGRNRKKETYLSTVQNRGIVENVRDAYVVEDWDITSLGLGQAVIGMPGIPPFLFRFEEYISANK